MQLTESKRSGWLDRPFLTAITIDWETVLFVILLILAIVTRFYILEARVMSHDENSHVYYSWRLYRGYGFSHDPLMHGPLQFHLLALSYFMFGDNDFTARIPAVLFNIATVAFAWKYRRYLGRIGSLIAGVGLLISPYILFYGRYVRNEAFVGLFGVITLWAILRYLETGQARYTYWLTAATVLHFTTKETSFIYVAQALLFLGLYLVYRVTRQPWAYPVNRRNFLLSLMIGLLLVGAAGGAWVFSHPPAAQPAENGAVPAAAPVSTSGTTAAVVLLALGAAAGLAAIYFALRGYTLARLRQERSFDLLILLGTLVLPQLSAFPVFAMGWNIPTNAGEVSALSTTDMVRIAACLIPMGILSVLIGVWWDRRRWLVNAAIFYAIFTVFYTTVFTNGAGFFTGIVGSLGYWLKQQDVNRGSQPWYYYALVQIPQYEYLPALGSLLAGLLAIFGVRRALDSGPLDAPQAQTSPQAEGVEELDESSSAPAAQPGEEVPVLALLGFWAITSLIAFSLAGEKMPWLTFHITLPMILLTGWSLGYLVDTTDWQVFRHKNGWIILTLLPVFLVSLLATTGTLLGAQTPFSGKLLEQLQATSTFLMALIGSLASGLALYFLVRTWPPRQFVRVLTLTFFAFLALLTWRTAMRASYINYDNAKELLVYAHSAGGVKEALAQIEEISRRTTNSLGIAVAYDNETSYPYLWYLRNYPAANFYGANPSRSLREAPVILVGDANYSKIEPVVGQAYNRIDYVRLWWPNQDYFNLTPQRVLEALSSAPMRAALFDIWLNADYTAFGKLTNQDMSLPNWNPAARMRLYIRKDIVNSLWNYGVATSNEPVKADAYEGKQIKLEPDRVFGGENGQAGSQPGQYQRPRGLAVAADGSLYVADTGNHRIQHLSRQGEVLQVWGSFTGNGISPAPPGTFNEPWGIALSPDGFVYVADTWNHRLQKFDGEGKFVKEWGYFGQSEKPEAFWGPRAVAVDSQGRVFVTDTGNKRVVVFDADGQYLTQFGGAGLEPGKLDEPVGLAVDAEDQIYVADTWNQRIQVFQRQEDGSYLPANNWEVSAWYGQSLDNKPYLTIDAQGHLFAADPEGYRVLEFSNTGEILRFWGDYSTGVDGFGLVGAVAADPQGGVWVTDTGNQRLMHFTLP